MVAQGVLNDLGLQADIANHGKEAIESLLSTHNTLPYSLVLMDCQMPEMDGYEATKAIRVGSAGEKYKAIPIVAMTANAMQGDRQKCLSVGMDDYLSKPINPEKLLSTLKQYLKFTVAGKLQTNSLEAIHTDLMDTQANDSVIDLTWDKEGALIRIGGNEGLLKTLAGIFARDGMPQLSELKSAIESGKLEDAAHVAHSVKGVAANLGGLKLQTVAAAMEQAAKSQNVALLEATFQEFEDQTKA